MRNGADRAGLAERASCETDLARQFPLVVVVEGLGNTQVVAMRHYVDVTDADFERAVGVEAAQKAAQHTHPTEHWEPQATKAAQEKSPVLQGSASSCDTLQNRAVEAAGIEPASRDISMTASTCVVG